MAGVAPLLRHGLGVGVAARDRAAGLALRLEDARELRVIRERLHDLVPARLAQAEALVARIATSEAEARLEHFCRELDVDRSSIMLSNFVAGYAALLVPDEARLVSFASGPVVLEGAQGVLLDPQVGFPPHVTKTPSTFTPALELVAPEQVVRVGVLRAYAHRHGPGPLPTEDPELTARLTESHNVANRWQGPFRVGWLDLVLARYAVAVSGGVDRLALTCVDRLQGAGDLRAVTAYAYTGAPEPWFDEAFEWRRDGDAVRIDALRPAAGGRADVARVLGACRPGCDVRLPDTRALMDVVASALGVPIDVVSVGPTWRDKDVTSA